MITMLQIIINNIKIINEILNTEQKNVSDLKTSVNQSIGEIYTIINIPIIIGDLNGKIF